MTQTVQVYPCIELRQGQAVRLVHGRLHSAVAPSDPVKVAREYVAQGATWLHVIDTEAQVNPDSNTAVIAEVVQAAGVPVQLSGGITSAAGVDRAVKLGCRRAIIGTAGLADLDWVDQEVRAARIDVMVSLEAAGANLAARGVGMDLGPWRPMVLALQNMGCLRLLVTDQARSGSLVGPNMELLMAISAVVSAELVYMGGIRSASDVARLRGMSQRGVRGLVVGRALSSGTLTLQSAIRAAGKQT